MKISKFKAIQMASQAHSLRKNAATETREVSKRSLLAQAEIEETTLARAGWRIVANEHGHLCTVERISP